MLGTLTAGIVFSGILPVSASTNEKIEFKDQYFTDENKMDLFHIFMLIDKNKFLEFLMRWS